MLKSSSLCLNSSNLGTFWLKIEQFWPFEEISIFSNGGHLGYRTALTDTMLKGTHPGTIPARFGLIWFSGFRGEDLNVIFYQNMPNLHNRYISAERKISQKNPEYMLNYSLPCSSFWLTLKQQWTIKISSPLFLFLAWWPSWLKVGITGHNFGRGPSKDHSTKVWLQLAQWFLRRRLKCEMLTDGRRTKSDDNSSHGLKARWAKKGCDRATSPLYEPRVHLRFEIWTATSFLVYNDNIYGLHLKGQTQILSQNWK